MTTFSQADSIESYALEASSSARSEKATTAEGDRTIVEDDLRGLHILSVDDDRDSLEITAYTLELAGAHVTSVTSGAQALQSLTQLVPDVLISDVGMPELDGYMLIGQIRALPISRGGQLKAIALTAYAQETDRQRILSAGFQRYLRKPVDPDVLVSTVRELIGSEI